MDAFRETTPEEAKMAVLQFLGQNLGEIKDLDSRIINKTNTLQGNTLNVNQVLNSIPSNRLPSNAAPAPASLDNRNTVVQSPQVPFVDLSSNLQKISLQLDTIIKLLESK